jgi:hypothetical protein
MTVVISGTDGVDTPAVEINGNTTYLLGAITYLSTVVTGATYTTPPNARALYVEVVGGGGGGGGCDGGGAGTSAAARSGGGAGYTAKFITSPAVSYTYTVGAGGTGGAAGNNDGTAGGNSSFSGSGVSLTATGGGLGAGVASTSGNSGAVPGGTAGSGSGGDINLKGSRATARSIVGGDLVSLSAPGCAPFFGGGNTASGETTPDNATNYGEGGAGASAQDVTTNFAGGDGYQGVIRITVYY